MSLSRRWLLPAGVTAALVGGSVVGPAVTGAVAEPQLPEVGAAELLARVAAADVPGLSGTVHQTTALGLPALPSGVGGGGAGGGGSGRVGVGGGVLDLATGEHTVRVWVAGPDKVRLAVLDPLAERVAVRDGGTVTTYDSRTDKATVIHLPARNGSADGPAGGAAPGERPPVADAAARALAAVDPTTRVSVGRSARVAGRDAYELRLAPRDPASLVDEVRLAVDGATSVPLRVTVRARGHREPAYEVGFTRVEFATPKAALFRYTPPATAEVTERTVPAPPPGPPGPRPAAAGGPTTVGSGWTQVAVLPGVDPAGLPPVLLEAMRPAPGGRLLTTRLLTAYLRDDGTLYLGAVTPDALLAAAGR